MKLFKKAKKGFTLVELVVVIAVIAILAAVSVGAYFGVTESAKNSQAAQEGKALHTNIVLVANDPANTSGATFAKDGISVTTLIDDNDDDARNTFEEEVEAAAGVDYVFAETTDSSATHNYENGAYVFFEKTGGKYTKMTYYVVRVFGILYRHFVYFISIKITYFYL